MNEPRLSTTLWGIDEDPAAAMPVGRPGRKRLCRKLPNCGPLGGQSGQAKVSPGRKDTARAEGPCNVASDLWVSTFAFKSHYGNVTYFKDRVIFKADCPLSRGTDHSPVRNLPGEGEGVQHGRTFLHGKSLKGREASPNLTHFKRLEAFH